MVNIFNLEEIVKDLSILNDLEPSAIFTLCDCSCDYILKGLNKKTYAALGQKLNIEPSEIERCISGIAYLFLRKSQQQDGFGLAFPANDVIDLSELCVSKANQTAAHDTVQLSQHVLSIVDESYKKHEKELAVLEQTSYLNSTQYKGLQWRLESQLASRSVTATLTPRVVVRLDLERDGKPESIALTSDIPNILHWSQMVEQALAEARTQNARKIQRITS